MEQNVEKNPSSVKGGQIEQLSKVFEPIIEKHGLVLESLDTQRRGAARGVFDVKQARARTFEMAKLCKGAEHARCRHLERRRALAYEACVRIEEGGEFPGYVGDGIEVGASNLLFGEVHNDVEKRGRTAPLRVE